MYRKNEHRVLQQHAQRHSDDDTDRHADGNTDSDQHVHQHGNRDRDPHNDRDSHQPPTVTPTGTGVPNGGACDDPADCMSGNCVDDTCCAEASCPPGQSCNNPGNAGVCSQNPTAPAPALSRGGVLATAILLLALGSVALRHRSRGP